LNAAVNREKHVWEGFYEELFDKAIRMWNERFKKNLQPGNVKAQIIAFTAEQMRQLVEIWLPLYTANIIDLNYMLSKIPDADPKKIIKALDERQRQMLDAIKRQEDDPDADPVPGQEEEE
jgi:hypothetical protein